MRGRAGCGDVVESSKDGSEELLTGRWVQICGLVMQRRFQGGRRQRADGEQEVKQRRALGHNKETTGRASEGGRCAAALRLVVLAIPFAGCSCKEAAQTHVGAVRAVE